MLTNDPNSVTIVFYVVSHMQHVYPCIAKRMKRMKLTCWQDSLHLHKMFPELCHLEIHFGKNLVGHRKSSEEFWNNITKWVLWSLNKCLYLDDSFLASCLLYRYSMGSHPSTLSKDVRTTHKRTKDSLVGADTRDSGKSLHISLLSLGCTKVNNRNYKL